MSASTTVCTPRLPAPGGVAVAIQCALACMAVAPAVAFGQAVASPDLAPVTVMGEKMGRTELESTAAVTVFTADEVSGSNKKSVLDLVSEVPNVTIGEFGGIANIRGTNGAGPGFSSLAWRGATRARTATVVDGVSQVWTGGNLLSNGLWDVEQVEVLRGPQSTMQGRSAVGGAVVLKSKDPSFKPEAAVRTGLVEANGRLQGQTAAVVSGPVSDSLAYRLSADVTRGAHFINYVDRSSSPGVDFSSDPDRVLRNDIKAKLLWAPKHNPDLLSRLDVQHQSQKGPYLNQVNLGDAGDYLASSDKVNHRIGDTTMSTIVSNTTYQMGAHQSVDVLASVSRVDAGFVHNQTAPTAANTGSYFNSRSRQDGMGLEARMNWRSPHTAMKSMVGVSYFKDDLTVLAKTYGNAIRYSGDTKTDATSVFGEVDYPLSDRLAVIAGGRVERESQDRNITDGVNTAARNASKTYVLPRLATRYKADDKTVLGLDVRKGYNPAGVSMDANTSRIYSYETEYVTALEASLKKSINNGRGTVSVNVFNNAFKDYQARNGQVISNVDKATIRGIEFAVSSEVGKATHAHANASFQSARIDRFAANAAYVGNKLPYAAPRTLGLGVTHKLTPQLTLSGNAKYVAAYMVDISNVAGAGQQAKAGGYTLVDLGATYAISKKASVRAYVNNLFDKYVVNTYFQGTTTQDVLAPRTVGVQFDYTF